MTSQKTIRKCLCPATVSGFVNAYWRIDVWRGSTDYMCQISKVSSWYIGSGKTYSQAWQNARSQWLTDNCQCGKKP